MGLKAPLISEIAPDTWLVNEFGLNNMYILKGSERSLVIDCGSGFCDFRSIVESLVDNPYDLLITHGHSDHLGAIHQFEKAYMNDRDRFLLEDFDKKGINLYDGFLTNNNLHIGDWDIWDVTEDMICPGSFDTEVCPLHEGDVFDLGNRKITCFDLPGHSPGHMYFIDDFSRIAFTGDCVNADNGSKYAVSTHIRRVQRLLDGYGVTYDRIFTGHTTYCGKLNVRSHSIQIVRNIADAYRALLRGEAEFEWRTHHLYPDRYPPHRVIVYGEGEDRVVLAFNEKQFWEDGEEHIIP